MFTRFPGVTLPTEEIMPRRQSDGAVGYDIRAVRVLNRDRTLSDASFPVTLQPGDIQLFGSGIIMAIPEGVEAQVRPRSGLSMLQVTLANGIGTIDPDYRGEAGLLLENRGTAPHIVNEGDRVAQILFNKVELPELQYVENIDRLPLTRRGAGGFGSTGVAGDGLGTSDYDSKIKRLDRYFMKIVLETAKLSDCVRGCDSDELGHALRDERGDLIGQTRRLGCVFAIDTQILASGYNCNYPGAEPCSIHGCLRTQLGIESGHDLGICRAIHAEELAVIHAANKGVSLAGSTMYVNAEPCVVCAKTVAALDIEALVILDGGYGNAEGLETVRRSGTQIRHMTLEDLV